MLNTDQVKSYQGALSPVKKKKNRKTDININSISLTVDTLPDGGSGPCGPTPFSQAMEQRLVPFFYTLTAVLVLFFPDFKTWNFPLPSAPCSDSAWTSPLCSCSHFRGCCHQQAHLPSCDNTAGKCFVDATQLMGRKGMKAPKISISINLA